MPGRDGTGPFGQGAMTGGGFGLCAVNRRAGRGMRRGRRGAGAGNGNGYGFGARGITEIVDDDKLDQLLDEVMELKEEVKQLKKEKDKE